MRLFALEKFSGTFETLMTTPVNDLQGGGGKIRLGAGVLHRDVAADAGRGLFIPVAATSQASRARWTRARLAECIWACFWSAACFFVVGLFCVVVDAQPDWRRR